jgi:hypothetical protein
MVCIQVNTQLGTCANNGTAGSNKEEYLAKYSSLLLPAVPLIAPVHSCAFQVNAKPGTGANKGTASIK